MARIIQRNKTLIFLFVILATAAFFRLWQLDSIPPGLYPDVAMNGNDALNTLKTAPPAGGFKVFYPANNGREGLMMWLIAASFSIFGVSIWSIKIVAAIIGILTVLGLYLLTKELFSKYAENTSRQIALLASFFLAISFWHVNFSRIGFRTILLPFILVFSFYFLFRGFRTNKILNFILAGVFFGLGFYTYTSFRMAILILPFAIIPYWFIYKKQNYSKKFLFFVFCFLFFVFIVALPLGIYFLQHPQDFISRATPISIFATQNPLKEFGKSLISHLAMFNFYGDANWRHNFSGSPELFWPIGILFLIGLFLSLKDLFSSWKQKNCFMFLVPCFLIGWFLIMLLPGILTYEGIPHSLRTIGVIPVVYIFAGLGGFWLYQLLNKIVKTKRLVIFLNIIFLILILAITYSQFHTYFFYWAENPKVKEAFTQTYAEIGYYLNSLPEETKKYVIVNEPGVPLYGISIPAQTPMFIEATKFGKARATYLKFEDLDQIKINLEDSMVIPLYDGRVFNELYQRFPWGEIEEKNGFLIFKF